MSGHNLAHRIAYEDLREWMAIADQLGEMGGFAARRGACVENQVSRRRVDQV